MLGESALLVGAVVAASILTSIAPPSDALAKLGKSDGKVGPGAVARTFTRDGVRIQVGIRPTARRSTTRSRCACSAPASPCATRASPRELDMLDMSMQQQAYTLPEISPGVYERKRPALVMVGHWLLGYTIEIPGRKPIHLQVVDKAEG